MACCRQKMNYLATLFWEGVNAPGYGNSFKLSALRDT